MKRLSNCCLWVLAVGLIALAGCAENSDDTAMRQRQEAALRDPFSYGTSTATPGAPNRPGQSGQTPEEQQKHQDNLKSEWNDFWNP